MLVKIFATDYAGAGRYSPPTCIGSIKQNIMGDPDPELINTSFAAPEPHHANVNAPLYPADKRL
jgi:hypothetical protein